MIKRIDKIIVTLVLIGVLASALASCGKKPETVETVPAVTNTPVPTVTVAPTVTSTPTKAPTETPEPTETPAPTNTSTPTPVTTDTPATTATATPEPTVHVHEWKSEVTEATCTAEGKIVYTCECGETYSEVIEKKEHAAGEPERVEPTVESEGKIIVKCSVCGEVLSEEIIAKLTPTPTNTPVPTATNTPVPTSTPTNTPKPTATNTPVPLPTDEAFQRAKAALATATPTPVAPTLAPGEHRVDGSEEGSSEYDTPGRQYTEDGTPILTAEEVAERTRPKAPQEVLDYLYAHSATPEEGILTLAQLGLVDSNDCKIYEYYWPYDNEYIRSVSFYYQGRELILEWIYSDASFSNMINFNIANGF